VKAALLDTNVLLALVWPNHQHHALVHEWFRAEARHGWATCALTQLGFVRLSANPAYSTAAVSPAEAATVLGALISHDSHSFWPSAAAASPEFYRHALGHQQVNDAYLVALALARRGRLVTLDHRLPVHTPRPDAVFVIAS
jgi:hypothetical protein